MWHVSRPSRLIRSLDQQFDAECPKATGYAVRQSKVISQEAID